MYISGIRYRIQGAKLVKGWRFSAGVGKMRPVISVVGQRDQHLQLAQSINFALTGKRYETLEEVWLDAIDDAGDVWTIERGPKGSVFRKNHQLLTLDEAQRSLLASLLDLDASLNQSEGLIAPVEFRQIISKGNNIAATSWDLNYQEDQIEVPSFAVAKNVAHSCAEQLGALKFSDPEMLAQLAKPIGKIYGAFQEIAAQNAAFEAKVKESSALDQGLEVIQSEVDVLNQIDQLLRRINEGGESFGRLSSLMDSYKEKISEKESKWTTETLVAVLQLPDAAKVLDQIVHLRAWGRFFDSLSKVRDIIENQVRPVNADCAKIWTEFATGARSNGQEIESSLASMLLGIKQMGIEVDRYVSQQPSGSHSGSAPRSTSWFDKLKAGAPKVVDEKFRDAAPALQHQRDWVSRLAREVDAVKIAIEYALQSSQGLVEKVTDIQGRAQSEISVINALTQKVAAEYERLKRDWVETASQLGINEAIGIEQVSTLIKDAYEYLILIDTRHDLAIRLEDRKAVQVALEGLVRQWWGINGSQKSVDISNVSFLIVEAKGALRYRDGRKQRIQKGLEESAKGLSGQFIQSWVQRRMSDLSQNWNVALTSVGAPTIELTESHLLSLYEAAAKCSALIEIAKFEEAKRFDSAALWPSRLDSAVVVYGWGEAGVSPAKTSSFLKSLSAFVGAGGMPVIMMICDSELGGHLHRLGTGQASNLEDTDLEHISGPKREGAVVKSELREKAAAATPVRKPSVTKAQSATPKKSLLSDRAEAALRVLNPKGLK